MNALFAPPEQAWQRISPAYAQVRRIHAAINVAVVTAMAATPLWLLLDRICRRNCSSWRAADSSTTRRLGTGI